MAINQIEYVSSKKVIRKIYRDLKPNYENWVGDAYDWMGEAMLHIGTFAGFETVREHKLTVKDFRAPLPCGFIEEKLLTYRGNRLNKITSGVAFRKENDLTFTDDHMYEGHGYIPEPGYYRFTFEQADAGDVLLDFKRFKLDPEGLPMIPDNIAYLEALEFYVLRQMIMGGYKHPIFNYQVADQIWKSKCILASNDLRYPSIDDAERTRRWWTSMVPRTAGYMDDFADFNGETQFIL